VGLFGNGAIYWPTPPADQPIIRRKALARCPDLAGSEWKGGKATGHPREIFFFKAFRRHSFCVILPPPKTTSTRFWICHSVRSQQSRSRTPFWRPRSTRSTRSTLAPLPILREALPGRVGRWSCADGLARVPWTPFVAERKATSPSFGSAELRSAAEPAASKTSKGNQARAPDLTSLPSILPLDTVRFPCSSIPPEVKSEK